MGKAKYLSFTHLLKWCAIKKAAGFPSMYGYGWKRLEATIRTSYYSSYSENLTCTLFLRSQLHFNSKSTKKYRELTDLIPLDLVFNYSAIDKCKAQEGGEGSENSSNDSK